MSSAAGTEQVTGWRAMLPEGVRPYTEAAPLAALFLGISSGFPYAMIGATLTTGLPQDGIDKKASPPSASRFLIYNFKWLWAPARSTASQLPDRSAASASGVSWLSSAVLLVIAAVINLALVDPVGEPAIGGRSARRPPRFRGATFDIVIDAYRIEIARAAPARRRVGHVAIWLADRLGRRGRACRW